MKFRCGQTDGEILASAEAARQWHRVFAWLPKEVAPGQCRWLEVVERRYPYARPAHTFRGVYGTDAGHAVYRALNLSVS